MKTPPKAAGSGMKHQFELSRTEVQKKAIENGKTVNRRTLENGKPAVRTAIHRK